MLILFLLISPTLGLEFCSSNSNTDPKICFLKKDPPFSKPDKTQDNKPMTLGQSLTLYSIGDFDELESTITLNLLLAVFWNDSRLSSDPPGDFMINTDYASKIFFPTLKFLNVKSVQREQKYGAVDKDPFWISYPNHFEYQQALKVKLYCSFDLRNFPLDEHWCKFAFGSADFTPKWLVLNATWIRYEKLFEKCEDKSQKVSVTQNRLPFEISLICLEPFVHFEAGFNHSHAGIEIHFSRNNFRTLIGGFYLPTGIFAYLSLISFSIDVNMVNIKTKSFYIELNSLVKY